MSYSQSEADLLRETKELRGEIARLRQELAKLIEYKGPALVGVLAQRDALRAQLAAITPYAQHDKECDVWLWPMYPGVTCSQPDINPKQECSCGLAKILSQGPSEPERT